MVSKYLTIDREDYFGYEVEISYPAPTNRELENKILKALAAKKDTTPLYNGNYVRVDIPIANGWKVQVWYRGYTVGEGGEEIALEGGSNFSDAKPTVVDIGSGTNIFEIDLIGKNMLEYSRFTTASSGYVGGYDVITVDMTAMYPDGTFKFFENQIIDLNAPDVDEIWGIGFKEQVIGSPIKALGKNEQSNVDFITDDSIFYTDFEVKRAYKPTVTYTEGRFENDEKITVEYTYTKDGVTTSVTARTFILSEREIDELSGVVSAERELFKSLLGGGEIGSVGAASFATDDGGIYSSVKVTKTDRREDKPIVIEAQFPYDYKEAELRGKSVFFDVYVTNAIVYNAPELNDEFVTETLKISSVLLDEYEGDTPTEKYKNMLWEEIMTDYGEKVSLECQQLFFEHVSKSIKCDYDKLPVGEVKQLEEAYVLAFEAYYELYKNEYESKALAAADYFGISDGTKWREYAKDAAKDDIVQRMMIFYIAREENLMPEKAEADALYAEHMEEYLNEYLEAVNCRREDYATEDEYAAAVMAHKADMISLYGGEDTIYIEVLEEILIPKIADLATVKKP